MRGLWGGGGGGDNGWLRAWAGGTAGASAALRFGRDDRLERGVCHQRRICGQCAGGLDRAGALGAGDDVPELAGEGEGEAFAGEDERSGAPKENVAFFGREDLFAVLFFGVLLDHFAVFAGELGGVDLGEGVGGVFVFPPRQVEEAEGAGGGGASLLSGWLLLRGVVDAAVPVGGEGLGHLLAAEEFGEDANVELAHDAEVVRDEAGLGEERVDVGQGEDGDGGVGEVGGGGHDFEGGRGWVGEDAGEGGVAALFEEDLRFEGEAVGVGEEEGLLEEEGSAGEHGRAFGAGVGGFEAVGDAGDVGDGFAGVAQAEVEEDDHGLAFGDGGSGGVLLVGGEALVVFGDVFGDAEGRIAGPLLEVDFLVLEGVGELVGEDGLLVFGGDPIEEVHGFGLVVVEAGDLLGEELEEEGAEVEVAVEQAELFEDQLGALHALGVLVFVELLAEIRGDFGAGDEAALDGVKRGQVGVFADELGDLVDGGEEFFRLLLGHGRGVGVLWLRLGGRLGYGWWRGGLGLRGLRAKGLGRDREGGDEQKDGGAVRP